MSEKQVYILKHPVGFYKIGVSNDPPKRKSAIETGTPFEYHLVRVYDVQRPGAVERALHEFFAWNRVTGEWFFLNEQHLQVIDENVHQLGESPDESDIGSYVTIPRRAIEEPEPGDHDVDMITGDGDVRDKKPVEYVKDTMERLEDHERFEDGIPIGQLVNEVTALDDETVMDVVERMKQTGELYEPVGGHLRLA